MKLSIRLKLVLASTLLVAGLLITTSAALITISQRSLRLRIEDFHTQLAQSAVGSMEAEIKNQLSFLTRLGQMREFHVLKRESLDPHLEAFLKFNPLFRNIWVFAADGRAVSLQNRSYSVAESDSRVKSHLHENFNQYDNAFEEAAKEVLSTREPRVSQAITSTAKYILIPCIAPIIKKGEVIGIISGGIFLVDETLNFILRGANPSPNGWTMLTDDSGRILAYYSPSGARPPDTGRFISAGKQGIWPAQAPGPQRSSGKVVLEGKSFLLTSHSWGNMRMKLFIAVPEYGIVSAIKQFRRELFLVSFISFAMALVLFWALADRLARPLGDLIQGLKILSRGNYGFRLEADRNDELGAAMEAFNELALSLSKNQLVESYWQEKVYTSKLSDE